MALHAQLNEILDAVLPVVQQFHGRSMYAPHAAMMGRDGVITGHALTSDGSNHLSVEQALAHFAESFRPLAQAGEISASAVFYHSVGIAPSSGRVELSPASTIDECRVLVGLLEHESGQSVYIVIPYRGEAGSIEYDTDTLIEKPPAVFVR
jgi:hypothetical protein